MVTIGDNLVINKALDKYIKVYPYNWILCKYNKNEEILHVLM